MGSMARVRAAVYCRISDDDRKQGLGVKRQEADGRAYVEAQGWTLAEACVDNDVSAFRRDVTRPAFERLLGLVDAASVEAVVVWKLDRLARQPRDLERLIDAAERTGVRLVSATEPIDTSSSAGMFVARLMVNVAHQESAMKSERVRRKQRELAERGMVAGGGHRAFGYERDGVTVRPEEAELVREAAERFLDGEGLRTIARDWRERGLRSVRGKDWTASSLRVLLRGPRIAGLRQYRGRVIGDAVWPAIITREQRAQILARLHRNRPGARSPERALLSGLLRCGRCGHAMHGTRQSYEVTPGGARGYTCSREACKGVHVRAALIEAHLAELVAELVAGERLAGIRASLTADSEAEAELVAELEDADARLDALAMELAEGRLSTDAYGRAVRAVEQRKQETEHRLGRAASARVPTPSLQELEGLTTAEALREAWPELDAETRRGLIELLVAKVSILPTEALSSRRRWNPERVVVTWRA